MRASDKENSSKKGPSYIVPSVSNSFADGSLEKMLQGMSEGSLRKFIMDNEQQGRANRRPMSSYNPNSGLQRSSRSVAAPSQAGSRASFSSAISRVPELAPFQLMNIANDIYLLRRQICDEVLSRRIGSVTLRDALSSSKILQILSKVGYRIEIGNLKALLKELGFNWNGPACSISQLLPKLKGYLNPHLSNSH